MSAGIDGTVPKDTAVVAREQVIEIIDSLSEAQLQAELAHLRETVFPTEAEDDFDAALDDLVAFSHQVSVSPDAATLIRQERDWHASRVP